MQFGEQLAIVALFKPLAHLDLVLGNARLVDLPFEDFVVEVCITTEDTEFGTWGYLGLTIVADELLMGA